MLFTGCGGGGKPIGERAIVQGKVTLDGQPLKLGSVAFIPDESKGSKGTMATGGIKEDGTFTLTTDRESSGDGALVGYHRVKVYAVPFGKPEDPPLPSLIPEKYNEESTSGLTAEVKAGQVNTITLELKSK